MSVFDEDGLLTFVESRYELVQGCEESWEGR